MEYSPVLSRQTLDDEVGRYTSLSLTWQATPRHKVTAFALDNYHCKCHFGLSGGDNVDRSEAVPFNVAWNNIYQVGWTFPATRRLLVQASAALAPSPQIAANQP